MRTVTKSDVLAAADALLFRLDLIRQLDTVLPQAESGDAGAMVIAASCYASTDRPQLATEWFTKAAQSGWFTRAAKSRDQLLPKLICDDGTWKFQNV